MTSRGFRIVLVMLLAVLTLQGWTGDTVNLFAPTGGASSSDFFATLQSLGGFALWHTGEAMLLGVLAVVVLVLAFVRSTSSGVRIASVLGLVMIASAAYGGVQFVNSGLTDAGASAQMGGSFIGAYASYFIALYYSRNSTGAVSN
jgi:hypothetical protein